MTLEIHGKIVLTEPSSSGILEHGRLLIDGDRIRTIERTSGPADPGSPVPAGDGTILGGPGRWVMPGVINLHTHGGGGVDFIDATPETLPGLARFFDAEGVTRYLATLVSGPEEQMVGQARIVQEGLEGWGLEGIHFEGPFLSANRCGLHPPEALKLPDPDLLQRMIDAVEPDRIPWFTLAPELPGATELLERFRGSRARFALGHTEASFDQTQAAIRLGADHATHLFNAMGPLHQREPGPAGAFLNDPFASVEVIPDLHHLHPALLGLVLATKGIDQVIAVTDALGISSSNTWCGHPVTVDEGVARFPGGGIGSILRTRDMIYNLRTLGLSMPDVARLVATNPGRRLGRSDIGSLRPGYLADVLILDGDFEIVHTIRAGRLVHSAP